MKRGQIWLVNIGVVNEQLLDQVDKNIQFCLFGD